MNKWRRDNLKEAVAALLLVALCIALGVCGYSCRYNACIEAGYTKSQCTYHLMME
jgi:hypothetical protein